jgi:hypothetical protein
MGKISDAIKVQRQPFKAISLGAQNPDKYRRSSSSLKSVRSNGTKAFAMPFKFAFASFLRW